MRRWVWLTIICMGCLLSAAGWYIVSGRAETPLAQNYISGVDVARYQGDIDWQTLAGDDVSFAFIKATEGGDWTDPMFQRNWIEAKRAGVLRGAYHFFTLCRDATAQAEHFVQTVGDMTSALVPALDAEHMGPCREGPTMSDVADGVLTFLDTVHARTGKRPIIYTTKEFHERYLDGRVPGERFWLRSLYLPPDYGPDEWLFWQHSGMGRRRGVSGPVDLNVFAGDPEELKQLSKP